MDLPIDILVIINSYLDVNDHHTFLIINPKLAGYIRDRYCRNSLIRQRFERISKLRDDKLDVVLDRMYYHHPYHEESMLIVNVMANIPSHYNIDEIDVSIIYTKDGWNSKEEKQLKLYYVYDDSNIIWELNREKMIGKSAWVAILPTNIWFCIRIESGKAHERRSRYGRGGRCSHTSYRTNAKEMIYDNNEGWNYCDDEQYHHIPSYYDINKYPFMDYWYSDYLCMDIMELEDWLKDI
ncbi:Hypothetical protein ORPV_890 [Orpheovirus IHUMI-LCC2]|uniref:F-box domain-containing protein n=1 Tax=Orpheovirus IHUMI-LCC2 TaxID=2023057 RepID=A0A2I2L5I2_9VIRU|nr:Hypothetical protein ORPV_890 [Orpheovirus IHUMI-LCC2]SNW62794.1 Hypothetical protein ORPV_890 [Orpheovirus IHUMI-LCC2]